VDTFTWFGLGGLGFAVLGVLLLAQAARAAAQAKDFRRRALTTRASVVELRERWIHHQEGPSSIIYVPVVRFVLPDGRQVESATMHGRRPAPARVGDVVEVMFDPAEPTRVDLVHGSGAGVVSCVWIALGVGFVLMGSLFAGLWLVGTRVLP
jgi:hypothetical protein